VCRRTCKRFPPEKWSQFVAEVRGRAKACLRFNVILKISCAVTCRAKRCKSLLRNRIHWQGTEECYEVAQYDMHPLRDEEVPVPIKSSAFCM
jgi:hypothetical protein